MTAGPKTGFGLLPSNDGIAFWNSQALSTVTPITNFEQQLQQDKRGRQADKLYAVRRNLVGLRPADRHGDPAPACSS